MLRAIILVMSVGLATAANAVDYRWTFGFAQGTTEAIIANAAGATVNLYCPGGQTDYTPGMFIESRKIKVAPDEQLTVQIIVDGNNYTFYLAGTQFLGAGRANLQSLLALSDALASSKSKSFTVEYPKYKTSETFSLLDARKSLGVGKKSALGACVR